VNSRIARFALTGFALESLAAVLALVCANDLAFAAPGSSGFVTSHPRSGAKHRRPATADDASARDNVLPGRHLGVSLLGGANYHAVAVDGETGTTPRVLSAGLSYTFGARVDFLAAPRLTIEGGFQFANQVFDFSAVTAPVNLTVTVGVNTLQLPVIARYWVTPEISLGGGLAFSKVLGDFKCGAPASYTCTLAGDYAQTGLKSFYLNYLATLGLRGNLQSTGYPLSLTLDFIFMRSLNQVSDPVKAGLTSWTSTDLSLLGGVRLGL
jgi:hypothetical protein